MVKVATKPIERTVGRAIFGAVGLGGGRVSPFSTTKAVEVSHRDETRRTLGERQLQEDWATTALASCIAWCVTSATDHGATPSPGGTSSHGLS